MKKILFLLLLTVSVYGQNPSRFAKIQITGNTNSATATKVNVQEANGEVNTQTINTGFNKNIGLGSTDVVGATTLLNQYVAIPSDWSAQSYVLNSVVFYGGKQWIAKIATVAGDVPAVSPKWEEITFESLANKTISVDAVPTDGSDNAVSSNGVFDALATKAPISSVHNPVTLGTANGLSLSTQVLSLGLAGSGSTGALSSTDWNTFNGKQNALTNPITGTGANGQISFWNGTNSQTGDSGLFWNNSTKRLQLLTSDSRLEGGDSVGRLIVGNSTTTSYIEIAGATRPSVANDISLVTTTGKIGLFTNSTERLRVTNAGRFLLGQTTDNLTDIAQFNGSAISTAWKVTGGLASQYQTGTGTVVDFGTSVRGSLLTGYVSGAGTVASTDNVLQAIQKLNGNNALNAPLASPALTGTPTAPTATAGTNTTQVATTAFVLENTNANGVLEFNTTDRTVWNNGKGDVAGNTFFGQNSFASNTTGTSNTGLGVNTLTAVTTQNENTAIGLSSLRLTTGFGNTAVGVQSLENITNQNGNTAIGLYAGRYYTGNLALTSSASSVFVGSNTKSLANTTTNEIVIGANAIGAGSNTATLGDTNITKTVLGGVLQKRALDTAPASATATGTLGEVRITATHIYVCTATNTWVRTALTTW